MLINKTYFANKSRLQHSFCNALQLLRNIRYKYSADKEVYNLYTEDRSIGEDLIFSFEDDFSKIHLLTVENWNKWNNFNVSLTIYINSGDFEGKFELKVVEDWEYDFSFGKYFIELSRLQGEQEFAINPNSLFKEINLEFGIGDGSLPDIISAEKLIHKYHEYAIKILTENSLDSVISTFQFPNELKTSCEQYILYFAQFLQDLGINATSDLKEEAGKVLFSVTPTDDVEALDKIREALAVYLNLPSSPILYDNSFAAMRLQQQIENLHHSQKMAARELQFNEKLLVAQSEMIHEKNVTISQLQSNNEQLIKIVEKISSPTIMMDSAENKEELEELYDGVKVGESETLKKWLGISLNPAKAIKTAVKNTFGKEENKSILGLDEETDSKE